MRRMFPPRARWALLLCAWLPLAAGARIIEIVVAKTQPFADGQPFGDAGPYERVTGTARGELDPADPHNQGIVDLDKAPRNAAGRVEYVVDFDLLRPVRGGNRKLLFDVTNRGRKFVLNWLLDGSSASANNPLSAADAGNALFLRQGWTIAWTGWDPDAPRAGNGMAIRVPVATQDGQAGGPPIVRTVREELVSGTRGPVLTEFKLQYEAASLVQGDARLTVRRKEGDARVELPHAEWAYADARTVRILTPGNAGSGPAVGSLYELHYPARDPKVLGIGFAATRDFVAYLRHDNGAANPAGAGIKSALAVGISQSGRYLRDHIAQGFNQDEDRRKVFDGVLAHISGIGRVFLNAEFGEPARTNTQHEDHLYPENSFPFSAAAMDDPVSGRRGSLLRGDGFDPLLIEVNTSTEYWQKGASLLHTDPLGTRDVALPPGARVYLVAGTQHGGRVGLTPARGPCANERNPHNPAPALRALTVALDRWVNEGIAPPPSRVPTLADKTLVAPDNASFPALPAITVARHGNEIAIFDDWVNPKPNLAKRYVPLVPATDADGNEVAGILLPDIAVPLATYTGWNLYQRPFPEGELCDRDGSYSAFAATRAERKKNGDPRLSIEERYASPADYVARVQKAADALVAARYLLPEDAAAYVARAQAQGLPRGPSR